MLRKSCRIVGEGADRIGGLDQDLTIRIDCKRRATQQNTFFGAGRLTVATQQQLVKALAMRTGRQRFQVADSLALGTRTHSAPAAARSWVP